MRKFRNGDDISDKDYAQILTFLAGMLAFRNDEIGSPIEIILASKEDQSHILDLVFNRNNPDVVSKNPLIQDYTSRLVYTAMMGEITRLTCEMAYGLKVETYMPKIIENYLLDLINKGIISLAKKEDSK